MTKLRITSGRRWLFVRVGDGPTVGMDGTGEGMVSSGVGLLFLLVLLEKHVPPPGLPPGAVMENGRGVPS